MRFDNPLYARADTMISYVHRNNAHLIISIWPDFGPQTPQFKEFEAINALLPFKTWPMTGGVKIYDPFNAQAREIYWKYLEGLVDQGIDAGTRSRWSPTWASTRTIGRRDIRNGPCR